MELKTKNRGVRVYYCQGLSEFCVRGFEIFGAHVRVRDFMIFSWTRHSDRLRSDIF